MSITVMVNFTAIGILVGMILTTLLGNQTRQRKT